MEPVPRRGLAAIVALFAAVVSSVAVWSVPSRAATPVGLSGARWIWYPEGAPATSAPVADRYFRKAFTAPGGSISEAVAFGFNAGAASYYLPSGSYTFTAPA